MCWEPGYTKTILHGTERLRAPVFYRIHVDRITGRHVILEPEVSTDTGLSMTDVVEAGMLQKGLGVALRKLRR